MANTTRQFVKTWKVQVTDKSVVLTLDGKEYELGTSAHAMAFDLQRAAGLFLEQQRHAERVKRGR